MRKNPHIFELNALVFLERVSKKHNRQLTLASVPREEWEVIAKQGFDLLWLMGVWKRSPAARARALREPDLTRAYDAALPGWKDEDVTGSPYAIYAYELDPRLGAPDDLGKLKRELNQLGLGLILDFVPNHLALDHPWTVSHPECFVEGSREAFKDHPGLFFKVSGTRYLAHGKDPYFLAWRDTVQVNFFSEPAREAAVRTLAEMTELADGVRCDMAMLGLNRVFENTWGLFLKDSPRPEKEYWRVVRDSVKKKRPDFLFIAEVYWDLEWELQQLGFDFTYDKKLYDRLLHAPAEDIEAHLKAEPVYQERSLRFIENHDEARSVSAFGREKSFAAAMVVMTVPGMRFIHDGQMNGIKTRLPIQLRRDAEAPGDVTVQKFYHRLLDYVNREVCHTGSWQLIDRVAAWPGNVSYRHLLSWAWSSKDEVRLVIINYSPFKSQGRLRLPREWTAKDVVLQDHLSGIAYHRDSSDLGSFGLFVDLEPWKAHLFHIEK